MADAGSEPSFKPNGVFLSLFFAIGVLLILGGLAALVSELDFVWHSELASGIVVDLTPGHEGAVAPVVSFETRDGRPIVWHSASYHSPPLYEFNQRVSIRYRDDDPAVAEISGQGATVGIGLGVMGVVFVVISGHLLGIRGLLRRPDAALARDGVRRTAVLVAIVPEPHRFLRARRWRLEAEVKSDGGAPPVRVLSAPIPFDPERFTSNPLRDTVEVVLDEASPDRSWMNLDWLYAAWTDEQKRYGLG